MSLLTIVVLIGIFFLIYEKQVLGAFIVTLLVYHFIPAIPQQFEVWIKAVAHTL